MRRRRRRPRCRIRLPICLPACPSAQPPALSACLPACQQLAQPATPEWPRVASACHAQLASGGHLADAHPGQGPSQRSQHARRCPASWQSEALQPSQAAQHPHILCAQLQSAALVKEQGLQAGACRQRGWQAVEAFAGNEGFQACRLMEGAEKGEHEGAALRRGAYVPARPRCWSTFIQVCMPGVLLQCTYMHASMHVGRG